MHVTIHGVQIFFEVLGSKLAIDGPRMREKPSEASDDIAKRIPTELLTYRRYPRCGHGAYQGVPEAFDEIRRFIEA